jgi:mono/diheme cytochrome c family protein
MPGFAGGYSDNEIAALSNYVIAHFGGRTGSVTATAVAKARPQNLSGSGSTTTKPPS